MSENAKYIVVTDDSFQEEVLNSAKPVMIDFWAAWCGPCRMVAPVVEELADEYEGRAKVAKLDVDHNPKIAMEYGVRSIPTMLFFKDGEVVDQLIGVVPKATLAEKLDRLAADVSA